MENKGIVLKMDNLHNEVEMMLLEVRDKVAEQEIQDEEVAETNVAEVNIATVDMVAELRERGRKTTLVVSAMRTIKRTIAPNGRTPTLASMSSTIWPNPTIFAPIA